MLPTTIIRSVASKRLATSSFARSFQSNASSKSSTASLGSVADALPKIELPKVTVAAPNVSRSMGVNLREWSLATAGLAKGVVLGGGVCAGAIGVAYIGGHLREAQFVAKWLD